MQDGTALIARSFAACLAVATGLLAVAATEGVRAQSGCILDNCADKRPPMIQQRFDRGDNRWRRNGSGPRGASRPGDFDFYVLSLSWSPGFCATGGDDKGKDQCRAGSNMGFVVHGLWPQYNQGYPSDCQGSNRFPSRIALQATDGVYPDEGLARYEWRKHGTCSGLSPNDYFASAKQARDTVVIPPQFKDLHKQVGMSRADVERAFTDANPRLRPGMLAAVCERGTLSEVRFCFTKDLKTFQACPEVQREGCRGGSMSVPPVR